MEIAEIEVVLKQIDEKTNQVIETTYVFLKRHSKTYGEFEKNVDNLKTQIKWEKPELAAWMIPELRKKLKEEYGKMPLQ